MKNKILTIEQMQELIALGIDTSKASMYWGFHISDLKKENPILVLHTNNFLFVIDYIPTFTLQDILEMLPPSVQGEPIDEFETSYSLNIDFSSKEISYYDYIWDRELISFEYDNLLYGAFQMLKWCKENKYI